MATVGELLRQLAELDPDLPVVVGYRECDGDPLADTLGAVKTMLADEVMETFGVEFESGPVCVLLTHHHRRESWRAHSSAT